MKTVGELVDRVIELPDKQKDFLILSLLLQSQFSPTEYDKIFEVVEKLPSDVTEDTHMLRLVLMVLS